jgi:hypothetical protein
MKKSILSLMLVIAFATISFAQRTYINLNHEFNGQTGLLATIDQWSLSQNTEIYTVLAFYDDNGNEVRGQGNVEGDELMFVSPKWNRTAGNNVWATHFVSNQELNPYLTKGKTYKLALYVFNASNDEIIKQSQAMESFVWK